MEEVFVNRNLHTATSVGRASGVVLMTLAAAGLRIAEYTPTAVKMALTGYGAADKTQVGRVIAMRLGLGAVPVSGRCGRCSRSCLVPRSGGPDAAGRGAGDMIGRLRGLLAAKHADRVVLDVGGVGYEVAVTPRGLVELPGVGEEAVLHTHLHVREDVMALYGFPAEDQRDLFRLLLGVSGVGPRVALAILGTLVGG